MKLGDIFKLSSGKSLPEKKRISGECNVYGGNGITGKHNAYFVEEPTIVIGRVGEYCGAVHLTTEKCWVTDNALMVTEWYQEVDKEYLVYALNAMDLHQYAKTVGQPSISQASVYVLDIELPEIKQQRKIVEILNSNKNILIDRQQELTLFDNLIKARFVELFVGKDYPLVALDDLSLGKGEYGAQSASTEYVPGRPRYVRITDINDDGSLNDDVVSSANVEDDEQYKLSYGDFMFARMGATVGKTYAYKTGNQIFAGYLIRYRLNLEKIMPEYLYAYTRLDEYKNWVLLNQSGAAQPGINAKKYGSLQIPVAPLTEQKAFEDFVKQVDKSKVVVQKALDETQLLFDSLMQKYFG